jgi:hypothetical protein
MAPTPRFHQGFSQSRLLPLIRVQGFEKWEKAQPCNGMTHSFMPLMKLMKILLGVFSVRKQQVL